MRTAGVDPADDVIGAASAIPMRPGAREINQYSKLFDHYDYCSWSIDRVDIEEVNLKLLGYRILPGVNMYGASINIYVSAACTMCVVLPR